MELLIDNNNKLYEIQNEFNKRFPYLKLEFFEFALGEKRIFSNRKIITDPQKMVGQIRQVHCPGYISLNGHQKVNTLELHFREFFDLHVQVFRKSGSVWLQTTSTDNWTLAEQNRKGEEMECNILEEVSDNYDQYHEQT